MCEEHDADKVRAALSRRGFLRTSGLVGAGALALGAVGVPSTAAAPASASVSAWQPDPDSPRFTLVVMPDTQYLFDDASIHPAPVNASLQFILDRQIEHNIVFLSHLGDLTEHGLGHEIAAISESFTVLDAAGAAYSTVTGNHDVNSSTDDQRGDTPYLQEFGPARFAKSPTYRGSTPDGYNSYHVFRAGGRDWLLLAMDWRPSAGGIAWAKQVLADHPKTPAILTTHEIVNADDLGAPAVLSDHGEQLWTDLIKDNDQIFLTLNGHFWPPGRTVLQNGAGHNVHLHITNYQNRYYGGAGMIRLYRFDLARNVIDVQTISPWLLAQAPPQRNELGREEVELSGDVDAFTVAIDFTARFGGFSPVAPRPARPAGAVMPTGTVAYWRFDGGADGARLTSGTRVADLSGHGNDLIVANRPGSNPNALTWSSDHHPDQPAHGSLSLQGARKSGDYLRTVDGAPLNAATFASGYTVEAFFQVPSDFDPSLNSWEGILSRWGLAGEAGKATQPGSGDPQEPVATLSLSDGHGLQWAVYPLNLDGAVTNWGHELPLGTWWHVAVVNDSQHTVMYVDGCILVRNPSTVNQGLATIGREWLLGGYEYGGKIDQVYYGLIGDVRIVDRPLAPDAFMIA
jgi:Concanavalin A-like lectin/glucanases superfamily